jgi:hypothetical protein
MHRRTLAELMLLRGALVRLFASPFNAFLNDCAALNYESSFFPIETSPVASAKCKLKGKCAFADQLAAPVLEKIELAARKISHKRDEEKDATRESVTSAGRRYAALSSIQPTVFVICKWINLFNHGRVRGREYHQAGGNCP